MIKRILKIGLIVLVVAVVINALSGEDKSPTEEAPTTAPATSDSPAPSPHNRISAACFTPSAQNPILENGSLFSRANWNDPSIMRVGDNYVMYASAAKSFDENVKIYRMTSTDGRDWALSPSEPVLEKSPDATAWDSKSVETPSVVFYKGLYYLFYTGYATSHTDVGGYKVGYATSPDGITWTKVEKPLLEPTSPTGNPNLDFNQYVVGEPGAVVFNNTLYVYFTAIGAHQSVGTTLQTIGVVSTSDGNTWSEPAMVLSPDQDTYPRGEGWAGFSTPSATVVNGSVHLFYDVVNEKPSWKQVALSHAVSANGLSGWKQDTEPLFKKDDFAWTAEEIRAPSALYENNMLTLWFAGHNKKANLGIGVATCLLE